MFDGLIVVQRLHARAVSTIESPFSAWDAVPVLFWSLSGVGNRLGMDAERAPQRGSLALSIQVQVGTCFPHTILQAACSYRAGEPELSNPAAVNWGLFVGSSLANLG